MRLFAKFIPIFLIFISSTTFSAPSSTPKLNPQPPHIAAKSYVLLDFNSGAVLADSNSKQQVEPASLTKMMTVYVVDQELKSGKLSPQDKVKVSKKAWQAPGSRMFLEEGSEVTIENLIKGIVVQSGNDASIAIAEHIAGTESAFAELMNTYAQMLGMHDSKFMNASGLPNKDHYTTAHDMSILAQALIKDFPETYRIYAEKDFSYNGILQHNRNRLLWRNSYVDGIKTGHTDNAGYCIVASGEMSDMRLIAVVMGTKSDSARTEETNKLLTWGFRFYETKLVYSMGNKIQDIRVWMGDNPRLNVGLENDLFITVPHGHYEDLKASLKLPSDLKAPISKGEVIGKYIIKNANDEIVAEKPIIALEELKTGGLWSKFKDYINMNVQATLKKIDI